MCIMRLNLYINLKLFGSRIILLPPPYFYRLRPSLVSSVTFSLIWQFNNMITRHDLYYILIIRYDLVAFPLVFSFVNILHISQEISGMPTSLKESSQKPGSPKTGTASSSGMQLDKNESFRALLA